MELRQLFELVDERKASDLIISAGAPPVLRINGKLRRIEADPLTEEDTRRLIYGELTEEQRERFERDKELDLSLAVGEHLRYRVNVYWQRGAVTAAFRPIPDQIPSLEDLGIPPDLSELAQAQQGLILVTGPTGHGKTTTQAALIDVVNHTREAHVITVEDPIEFIHHHRKSIVDQREIGIDTHTFADALKYVLRQDPDVILVGEMRDLETIQAALRAAETGHLVMATLHTNDAIQSVDRIIDVFPAEQQQQIRFMLSMTLLGVISQRLIPRAEGDGRLLAAEFLRNNAAISNLIREGKTHQVYSVMETNTKEGMITLDRCIKELYLSGAISYEDAAAHAKNPENIMDVG
jgi:twitching motility protein PilT